MRHAALTGRINSRNERIDCFGRKRELSMSLEGDGEETRASTCHVSLFFSSVNFNVIVRQAYFTPALSTTSPTYFFTFP